MLKDFLHISDCIDQKFFTSNDKLGKPDRLLIELLKIFEVIADGVLVTDANDQIVLINKNHQLLNHLNPKDIIGKTAFDLTRREKYWTMQSEFDVFEFKQDLIPRDFKMRSRWGQELIVTSTPVLDNNGDLKWMVFTSRDIVQIFDLEKSFNPINLSPQKDMINEGEKFVYSSKAMKDILYIVDKVSKTNSYVFLSGESGVGKDRIARKIHLTSALANLPFIHINCASIPHALFESELFGYEKGSFTGARNEGKIGLFELAKGGTLYLDEITEMSPELQAKLLQVLQERVFRRVGGTENIPFKARVISSTNRDINEILSGKGFRQDLYYRLCVIPIFIPPLRDREEDIPKLADLFINEYNAKHGQHKKLQPNLIKMLKKLSWSGNVRELQHLIERMVIMSSSDDISTTDYLNIEKRLPTNQHKSDDMLKDSIEQIEVDMIRKAATNHSNTRDAAKSLGISQATFLRKAKKYNITFSNES